MSPDGLVAAEWLFAAPPFELGGLPIAWQFSGRTHATSVMTEWNAYFTRGIPYEALIDLLVAVDASEVADWGLADADVVLDALGAQGWLRDADRPRTTASDLVLSCCLSLEPVPPLIQDGDPRPGQVGWQAWAEPLLGEPYLWCAGFSASVPHELVAAFASALVSPTPVARRTLPDGLGDRGTITLRDF
ncbi:DUF317 domain-containing protein [Streptomyces atriruber]|uniref:DUF317 domain-containing protein n=1 Tax=Streptomyces atriruber TaxID=545121 RepID=A0ABV3BX33_9ACTN